MPVRELLVPRRGPSVKSDLGITLSAHVCHYVFNAFRLTHFLGISQLHHCSSGLISEQGLSEHEHVPVCLCAVWLAHFL